MLNASKRWKSTSDTLGIYNGDSVANYAGAFSTSSIFTHIDTLVLLRNLRLQAKDMLSRSTSGNVQVPSPGRIDDYPITLPPNAPWPRTHFCRISEMYRGDVKPAPPDFLEGVEFRVSGVTLPSCCACRETHTVH